MMDNNNNLGASLQLLVNAAQANTQLLGSIQQVLGKSYIAVSSDNTFTGHNTFDGTTSFNGPAAFAGTNSFTGVSIFQAAVLYPPRVVTAAGAVTVATTDPLVIVINKTSGAATTVNLPAAISGMTWTIKDGKGDASTHNITITPAAGTIDGASTLTLVSNYSYATVNYNGTQWGRIA